MHRFKPHQKGKKSLKNLKKGYKLEKLMNFDSKHLECMVQHIFEGEVKIIKMPQSWAFF